MLATDFLKIRARRWLTMSASLCQVPCSIKASVNHPWQMNFAWRMLLQLLCPRQETFPISWHGKANLKKGMINELSAKASSRWRQNWKGGHASPHNIKSGSVWLQPDGGRWSKFLRFYRAYFNQESYAWVQHSLHLNLSFEFVASIFSDPDHGPFHELRLQFSEAGRVSHKWPKNLLKKQAFWVANKISKFSSSPHTKRCK